MRIFLRIFFEDFYGISVGFLKDFYWDYIGIILGLYWDCIGIVLGLYWDCIGIVLGWYWDGIGIFFYGRLLCDWRMDRVFMATAMWRILAGWGGPVCGSTNNSERFPGVVAVPVRFQGGRSSAPLCCCCCFFFFFFFLGRSSLNKSIGLRSSGSSQFKAAESRHCGPVIANGSGG